MERVYLDYAATQPLLPEVVAELSRVMEASSRGELGNPSALHSSGHAAASFLEGARAKIAALIDAEPSEIIFTSGGTEANNQVLAGATGPVAISAIEHPSIREPFLARKNSADYILPVDEWGIVKDTFDKPLALASVMLANNEIGTIEDIQALAKSAHQKGALFHTDATQAFGKIPLSVKTLDVDYMTISAHKIGGPVGIGALYIKHGRALPPLLRGGGQESGRRSGTSNVILAAGFAKAVELAAINLPRYQEVAVLRDQLRERLLSAIPYSTVNSPSDSCLPNILNLSFAGVEGESIQLLLDQAGIAVSTGSACAARSLEPSHVLMATRHDAEIAHSSLRISLGLSTTQGDLDYLVEVLPGIIEKLRGISTIPPGAASQKGDQ